MNQNLLEVSKFFLGDNLDAINEYTNFFDKTCSSNILNKNNNYLIFFVKKVENFITEF